MIKKPTFITGATLLALLVTSSYNSVFAQKSETPSAGARQAKVKIIQSENGAHYMLDTTLVLKEGQTLTQAIKEMKEKAGSFQNLGAKRVQPSKVPTIGKDSFVKVFPSRVGDSVHVSYFRTKDIDSLIQIGRPSRIYSRDSARVFFNGELQEARIATARALGKEGVRVFARELINGDSLLKGRTFFRIDTTVNIQVDTIRFSKGHRVHTLEVDEEGVLLHRVGPNSTLVDKTKGNVEITRIITKEGDKVILLKMSKNAATKAGKKNQKATKKMEAATEVVVSPNPSNGKFQVSFQVPACADVKLRIVDSAGKTVFQEEAGQVTGQFSRNIDLNNSAPGLYVIQIMIGSKIQSEKVLVR